MRYLSELILEEKERKLQMGSVLLPYGTLAPNRRQSGNRVNLLALGDVGGTVLMGLRLLGGVQRSSGASDGACDDRGALLIDRIGIFDLNEKMMRRYEREINQICFPDGRSLPQVEILEEAQLFECDMFVFCASRGVPPVGASGDVRMAQLDANRQLIGLYAQKALQAGYQGIFAVVSDPVDPLCAAAVAAGLDPMQVQGYGLGVMNARASYFARQERQFSAYLEEGRAFGPHGEDLVIANSIVDYDDAVSRALTEKTVRSNLDTRADGFKPYIAPALSSGAISLIETLRGGWNYSSVWLGEAFLGCRNRRTAAGIELENLPLAEPLYRRIETAYENLKKLDERISDTGGDR